MSMKNRFIERKRELAQQIENAKTLLDQARESRVGGIENLIREAAAHKAIVLDSDYVNYTLGNSWHIANDYSNNPDLEKYLKACRIYSVCQEIFRTFYESETFSKVCEDIAKGNLPTTGLKVSDGDRTLTGSHNKGYYRESFGSIQNILNQ